MAFDWSTAEPIKSNNEGTTLSSFDWNTANPVPVESGNKTAFDKFIAEPASVFLEGFKESVEPFVIGLRKRVEEKIGKPLEELGQAIGSKAFDVTPFEETPLFKFFNTEFASDEEMEKHPVASTIGMVGGSIAPFIATATLFPQGLLGTIATFATVEGVSEVGAQEILGVDKPLDILKATAKGVALGPVWHYASGLRYIGKPVASALSRAGARGAGTAAVSTVFGEDLSEAFKQGGVVMALSLVFEAPGLAKTALGRQIIKQATTKAKAAGFSPPEVNLAAVDAVSTQKGILDLVKTLSKVMKIPIKKSGTLSPNQKAISLRTTAPKTAMLKMSEIAKVNKVSDPLIQEAKKFKTAEEFVKSQKIEKVSEDTEVFIKPDFFEKGKEGVGKSVEKIVTPNRPLLQDEFKRSVVFRDKEGNPQGSVSFTVKEDGTLETRKDFGANVEIFVNPEFRRQGIATKLYNQAKNLGFNLDNVEGRAFTKEGLALQEARLTDIFNKAQEELVKPKAKEKALDVRLKDFADKKLKAQIEKAELKKDTREVARIELQASEDITDFLRKRINITKNPEIADELKSLPKQFQSTDKNALSADEAMAEINDAGIGVQFKNVSEMINFLSNQVGQEKALKAQIKELQPEKVTKLDTTVLKEKVKSVKRGFKRGVKIGKEIGTEKVKAIVQGKKAKTALSSEIKGMIKTIKNIKTETFPEDFRDMIEDIKSSVDFDKVRLRNILRREKISQQIVDEGLQEQVKELSSIIAGTMTVNDLRLVADTIKQLEHEAKNINKFLTVEKGKAFNEVVIEGTKTIQDSGGVKDISNIEKVPASLKNKTKEGAAKFIAENLRPELMLEMMDGFTEGVNTRVVWKPMNKATNLKLENVETANTDVSVIFQKVNIAKILNETVKVEGIERKLMRDEMMFIYANSFNEINLQHLINSGVTEEMIFAVERKLTDLEKESVHDMFEYYDKNQWIRLNKVYRNIKGKDMGKEESFFPINTLENVGNIEAIEVDIQQRNLFQQTGVPSSFTKERTGGKKAFKNFSFFKTVYKNLNQVEHYISYAETIRDVSKYLRNPNIKNAIITGYGQPIYNVLDQWVKDIAVGRDRTEGSAIDDFVTALRGNYVMYALGGNLSTVMKQPASYIQGAEFIGKVNAFRGTVQFLKNPIGLIKFVNSKSTQMKNRSFTQERELREILAGRGIAKNFGQKDLSELKQMIKEGSMKPILWADRATVTQLWKGAYDARLAETGSEQKAIEWADKAIRRTQPQARLVDLPDMFRSTPLRKMLTLFRNQPNQNFNLLFESYQKYKKATGDNKSSFKKFSSEIFFYMVVSGLFYGALSRKRLPKDPLEVVLDLANQPLGGLPILGDFVNKVKFPWGSANMIDSVISDGARVILSKEAGTKFKYGLKTTAQLIGVPGFVAAERLFTRESLKTKLLGGEKEKNKKKVSF